MRLMQLAEVIVHHKKRDGMGMVFKLLDPVIVDAGEELTVRSEADDLDLYG